MPHHDEIGLLQFSDQRLDSPASSEDPQSLPQDFSAEVLERNWFGEEFSQERRRPIPSVLLGGMVDLQHGLPSSATVLKDVLSVDLGTVSK